MEKPYRLGQGQTKNERNAIRYNSVTRVPVTLRIPYALLDVQHVLPHEARSRVDYVCPECGGIVRARAGGIGSRNRRHFYHSPLPAGKYCGRNEGELHNVAKHIILDVIWQWLNGLTDSPIIVRSCVQCRRAIEIALAEHQVRQAVLEYPLAGRRADVALLDGEGRIRLAVEVRDSHVVDEAKRNDWKQASIAWVELDVRQVLEKRGHWQPLAGDLHPLGITPGPALHVEYRPPCAEREQQWAEANIRRQAEMRARSEQDRVHFQQRREALEQVKVTTRNLLHCVELSGVLSEMDRLRTAQQRIRASGKVAPDECWGIKRTLEITQVVADAFQQIEWLGSGVALSQQSWLLEICQVHQQV